jgi:hypothetical protein
MRASARATNPGAKRKREVGTLGRTTDRSFFGMDSSQSTHDGTRKMVIYSCAW